MSSAPSELHARPTSAAAAPGERPVFADATDRRRHALRALGVAVAALAAAWLIALTLGVLGFDALPGVTLPGESQRAGEPAPASTTRSDGGDRQQVRAVTRSSPTEAAAAPARAIATRQASRSRRGGSSRRHADTAQSPSSSNEPGSPTTQAHPPAPSTPTSPGVSSAPAPAAQQPAATGNGRGRPESPGGRRSPTAGTGSGGHTTTPAPTPQSGSPGRSGEAPGHTR